MNDDYIPISYAVHWAYCPRRTWLEAQGDETDTYQMQVGYSSHARTDAVTTRGTAEFSSVELRSDRLGVTGKTDVVRVDGSKVRIREFKSTPVRKTAEVTQGMRVQLAFQKICLEEEGFSVEATEVYFVNHNQVINVELDDDDYTFAEQCVTGAREVVLSDYAPEPLEDQGVRCPACSHEGVCLPGEHRLASIERKVRPPIRDGRVVYLTKPGSYAHTKKGRMLVEYKDERLGEVPLETVQAVQVVGNVNLSGGLIRELLERDIPIQWCTPSGKLSGWSVASSGPNGQARNHQHVLSHAGCIALAREFIYAKISNQATQLRRSGVDEGIVDALRGLQKQCLDVHSVGELMGVEGAAANIYFDHWPELIKDYLRDGWKWSGRSGRPARDELNAMLNYVYALLLADEIKAIVACGLDPHGGFLHSSGRNKPALALDLMEEVRAPIADSVVQTVVNCQVVQPSDFEKVLGSVRMRQKARQAIIETYERRMSTEFTHPVYEYKVTWRRALEIQARQVLGVLEGSQKSYVGIRMR